LAEKRKTLSAKEVVADIRAGITDESLAKKYGMSKEGLQRLFEKLVAAKAITQFELDQRLQAMHDRMRAVNPEEESAPPETTLTAFGTAVVFKCPSCGTPQPQDYKVCPQCGVIVDKFLAKKTVAEEPPEDNKRSRRPYTRPWREAVVTIFLILSFPLGIIGVVGLVFSAPLPVVLWILVFGGLICLVGIVMRVLKIKDSVLPVPSDGKSSQQFLPHLSLRKKVAASICCLIAFAVFVTGAAVSKRQVATESQQMATEKRLKKEERQQNTGGTLTKEGRSQIATTAKQQQSAHETGAAATQAGSQPSLSGPRSVVSKSSSKTDCHNRCNLDYCRLDFVEDCAECHKLCDEKFGGGRAQAEMEAAEEEAARNLLNSSYCKHCQYGSAPALGMYGVEKPGSTCKHAVVERALEMLRDKCRNSSRTAVLVYCRCNDHEYSNCYLVTWSMLESSWREEAAIEVATKIVAAYDNMSREIYGNRKNYGVQGGMCGGCAGNPTAFITTKGKLYTLH